MPTEFSPSRSRVDVLVRSQTPGGARERQRELLSRLRHLEETGTIESVTIEVWGTSVEIPADGSQGEPVNEARERLAAFEEWAEQNGHTLEPAFRKRTASSLIAEETWEEIVFPIICMAIYDDDNLQAVFPCSEGKQVQTVEDCLTQLEAEGDREENESTEGSDRQPLEVER